MHLGEFVDLVKSLGKHSHHTAQEYSKAVQTCVDLIRAGEDLPPDEVGKFLVAKGWSD
jgi:hypothetical protein